MDLVVGATGMLGREVCGQLRAQGRSVRALIRTSSAPAAVDALRAAGVEACPGDLKDGASLVRALRGIERVVSTASATVSRAEGDDLSSVDGRGQLQLIEAARAAGVARFVFVSFPPAQLRFPLQDEKRAAEAALASSGLDFTVLQPTHFFETWFSPGLGFDAQQRKARVFGAGTGKMSFVSMYDVARVAARALVLHGSSRRTIAFGGPAPVSQRDVIALFERRLGQPFSVESLPAQVLTEQLENDPDPLARSFAALMLICGHGDQWQFDNRALEGLLDTPLSSAESFAARVTGAAAS